MVDDGFHYNHADLAAPYDDTLDWDFDDVDNDPFGANDQGHGTAVAGIIGADNNGTGAVGFAFDTSVVGYRIHANDDGGNFDEFLRNIRDSISTAATGANADVTNISQAITNNPIASTIRAILTSGSMRSLRLQTGQIVRYHTRTYRVIPTLTPDIQLTLWPRLLSSRVSGDGSHAYHDKLLR